MSDQEKQLLEYQQQDDDEQNQQCQQEFRQEDQKCKIQNQQKEVNEQNKQKKKNKLLKELQKKEGKFLTEERKFQLKILLKQFPAISTILTIITLLSTQLFSRPLYMLNIQSNQYIDQNGSLQGVGKVQVIQTYNGASLQCDFFNGNLEPLDNQKFTYQIIKGMGIDQQQQTNYTHKFPVYYGKHNHHDHNFQFTDECLINDKFAMLYYISTKNWHYYLALIGILTQLGTTLFRVSYDTKLMVKERKQELQNPDNLIDFKSQKEHKFVVLLLAFLGYQILVWQSPVNIHKDKDQCYVYNMTCAEFFIFKFLYYFDSGLILAISLFMFYKEYCRYRYIWLDWFCYGSTLIGFFSLVYYDFIKYVNYLAIPVIFDILVVIILYYQWKKKLEKFKKFMGYNDEEKDSQDDLQSNKSD